MRIIDLELKKGRDHASYRTSSGTAGILRPMAFSPETARPLNEMAEILLCGPSTSSPGTWSAPDIEIHDAVLIDNFCAQPNCSDGALVYGGLVQATDGNLYVGTAEGGTNHTCRFVGTPGCGTLFRLTPSGTRDHLAQLRWNAWQPFLRPPSAAHQRKVLRDNRQRGT